MDPNSILLLAYVGAAALAWLCSPVDLVEQAPVIEPDGDAE